MKNICERIFGISLRGGTLLFKSILIFFLAKFLDAHDVGVYGLILVTIVYCTYPLGMDFYTFSVRELIKSDREKWSEIISNQLNLHLVLYILFLPLFFVVFIFNFIPIEFILWFYVLLIFEHANQEIVRLLIAMSKPLSASFAIFFRQGAWVIVVIALFLLSEKNRNLETVFFCWSIGGFVALIFSLRILLKSSMFHWCAADWRWIKKGVIIAFPMFVAMLFMNSLTTLDKYWLASLQGKEVLGAYVLFGAMAASLVSFLDAGVFSFLYPKMIKAASDQDYQKLSILVKKVGWQTLAFSLFFSLFLLMVISPFLSFLNKPSYKENYEIFYLMLLAIFFNAISYIFHYALYSLKKDKDILSSHIFGFFVFILGTFVVSKWSSLYAVPIGLLLAYFSVLCIKAIVYFMEMKYNLSF